MPSSLRSASPATPVGPCPVPPGLAGRLHLNVPHVDFLIEQEHGSPLPLLAPVLGIDDLLDIDDVNLGLAVPQPVPPPLVHKSLQLALAVMLVISIGSVVVIALMQYDPDQPKLPRGLGVLEWLEPKLVIDVSRKQDVVEVHVVHLVLA